MTETESEEILDVNHVVLRGRVSADPEARELPSGTSIVSVRVTSTRTASTPMTAKSRQTSDWIDCVAWAARTRRSLQGWRAGDTVEVEGALRRRSFRSASGLVSKVEIEVLRARLVTRA